MKIVTMCSACFAADGVPNFASWDFVEIPDDLAVRTVCDRGHASSTALQNARFELLSEAGVEALAGGFYVEAVASFTASLERLHEYYVDIVARAHDVPNEVRAAQAKQMARQSERQLGAFFAAWLLDQKVLAPTLSGSAKEFRNKVIHQGIFPTRDEAAKYGQQVLDVAFEILRALRPHQEHVHRRTMDDLRARLKSAHDEGTQASTLCWNTVLSLSKAGYDVDRPVLEEAVRLHKERPKFHSLMPSAGITPPDG